MFLQKFASIIFIFWTDYSVIIIAGGRSSDSVTELSIEAICMSPNPETPFAATLCNPFKRATVKTVRFDQYGSIAIGKEDRAFLCGGQNSVDKSTEACYKIFDDSNTTVLSPKLSFKRFDAAASKFGDSKWWITGGKDLRGNYLRSTEQYIAETNV